jgi:hypothetical protein
VWGAHRASGLRPLVTGYRLQASGFGKKKQEGRKIPLSSPFAKGGDPEIPSYRKESIPKPPPFVKETPLELPPFVKEGRGGFYNYILNKLRNETARLHGMLITSLSVLKKGV